MLSHYTVVNFERHDRCDQVGNRRKEEKQLVWNHRSSIVVQLLHVTHLSQTYNHQEKREDCRNHSSYRFRSHRQTLTTTFIVGLLVNSLDNQGVHHQLCSTLCGCENDSHQQCSTIAPCEKTIQAKSYSNTKRIEYKIGNATVVEKGERIRDVTKYELTLTKKKSRATLKLHGK